MCRRVAVGMRLEGKPPMPSMLVTCPESAHLESIDYQDDGMGTLIMGCTAYSPPCSVSCARTCAARLDRRNRAARTCASETSEITLVAIRL